MKKETEKSIENYEDPIKKIPLSRVIKITEEAYMRAFKESHQQSIEKCKKVAIGDVVSKLINKHISNETFTSK